MQSNKSVQSISIFPRILTGSLLLLVLLMGLWFRWPELSRGLPYLYNEDEAHHINRTLEMAQSGDWDPHYFHKPSLHFYLRIPFVKFGFQRALSSGAIDSPKDVKTRDPFGLAGYNFTASHSGVIKWVRLPTLILSLLIIPLAFLVVITLGVGPNLALLAASFVAVNPALIGDSGVVGVDTLMAFMCLSASYLILRCRDRGRAGYLFYFAAFFTGLAVSSKYNAGPAMGLPLLYCLLYGRTNPKELAMSVMLPWLGFFAGSPYILISLPLFWKHLSYEVWHYAVAGHEGHSTSPGLSQVLFYGNWFSGVALGKLLFFLSLVGVALSLSVRVSKDRVLLLAFPAAYFLLMIAQKTNFTRNMLVMLPYLTVLAILAVSDLLGFCKRRRTWVGMLAIGAFIIGMVPSFKSSLEEHRQALSMEDSRFQAAKFIQTLSDAGVQCAVSGDLQFQAAVYGLKGVKKVDLKVADVNRLFQDGYECILAGPEFKPSSEQESLLKLLEEFPGAQEEQRVVRNPEVKAFAFKEEAQFLLLQRAQARFEFSKSILAEDRKSLSVQDCLDSKEGICWLQQLGTLLDFNRFKPFGFNNLKIEVMSPWDGQVIEVVSQKGSVRYVFQKEEIGKWLPISVSMDPVSSSVDIYLKVVRSPKEDGLSSDARRLGVAIRAIRISQN